MKKLKSIKPGGQFVFTNQTELMEVISLNSSGGVSYKRVYLAEDPNNNLVAPGHVEVLPLSTPFQNKKELLDNISTAIDYIEEDISSAEGDLKERAKLAVKGLRKVSKAIKLQD